MIVRTPRRSLLLVALVAMLVPLLPITAASAADAELQRLKGTDRIGTAVAVSEATFPAATNAIIARQDEFPDALASAYLANFIEGPILLTNKDELSGPTAAELQRLGVTDVFIVGGTAAVSQAVQDELDDNYEVVRLSGQGRLDTMKEIAIRPPAENVGTLGTSGRTALIARADEFADALAGGAIGYDGSFPTLLTDSNTLSSQTDETLDTLGIEYAIVLGGEGAVSAAVVAAIEAKGIQTQRLGGTTRTETAVEIAEFARDQLGFDVQDVVLARGDKFPDALSGGPYAGFHEAPILLAPVPGTLGDTTRDYLAANADFIHSVTVLGGTAAITDATAEEARTAAS